MPSTPREFKMPRPGTAGIEKLVISSHHENSLRPGTPSHACFVIERVDINFHFRADELLQVERLLSSLSHSPGVFDSREVNLLSLSKGLWHKSAFGMRLPNINERKIELPAILLLELRDVGKVEIEIVARGTPKDHHKGSLIDQRVKRCLFPRLPVDENAVRSALPHHGSVFVSKHHHRHSLILSSHSHSRKPVDAKFLAWLLSKSGDETKLQGRENGTNRSEIGSGENHSVGRTPETLTGSKKKQIPPIFYPASNFSVRGKRYHANSAME